MKHWMGCALGLLLAASSGCIVHPSQGAGGQGGATAAGGGGGGGGGGGAAQGSAVIRVQNNSNVNICYVRFSPASAPSWSGTPDALGNSVIGSGQHYDFTVAGGQWDIMLEACGSGNSPFGHPKLHESRQMVAAGQSYVLTFP